MQLLFGPGTERLTYMIVAPFAAWAMMTSYLERRNFVRRPLCLQQCSFWSPGFAERFLIRSIPASVAVQPIGVIMFATAAAPTRRNEQPMAIDISRTDGTGNPQSSRASLCGMNSRKA